jgi:uncharacterized membrane protein
VRKLALAVAAYVAIFAALALWRWHVWTFGTDTGTFAQVVSDAFGGFRDGPEQGTHFRFHWAPLLATLYPLVVLGRSGLPLQLAQIVLIGATALPLFGLARRYVDDDRAFAFASLALLYPPLGAVAFTEFHEIAFYPVLALALVWAADGARWRWFACFAVASALVREEACIVLAIVGVALAAVALVRREAAHDGRGDGLLAGRPREPERLAVAGVGLALVNLAALAFYYLVVIPRVGAWQPSRFYEYPFAHGPRELLAALAIHPAYLAHLATLGRFTYLLEAFVPLAFLPLRSRWSLLAVPGLLVVLLSSDPIAWRMGSHYAAIWAPWLLLGAVAALVRFARERDGRGASRGLRAAATLCVLFLVAINPMHVGHYVKPVYPHDEVARAFALVPAGAPVVTHDEWFAHVAAARPNATVFFCPYVRFAVFADDYPNDYFHDEIKPELERELASGRARVLARFGRVAVYERTLEPGALVGACVTPGDVRYHTLPQALRLGGGV